MARTVLRSLIALTGLLFIVIGVSLVVAPGRQAALFAIAAGGPAGLSTVRADLGGLFIAMGGFALAAAIRASATLLVVPLCLLVAIASGRLVNLIADGVSPDAVRSLAVELVAIVLFGATWLRLRSATGTQAPRWFAPVLLTLPIIVLALVFAAQRPLGLFLTRRLVTQAMANRLVSSLPDGLHVALCGSGSPMPDATRSGPCVMVIAGQHVFVVDVGEGGPRKIPMMGVQPGQVEGVLLTHFHSDHIGGLGELLLQRWTTGSHVDPLPVYGPQGVEQVVDGFNLAYTLDGGYRVAHHGEKTVPPAGRGGVARPFAIVQGSDAAVPVLQQDGLTIVAIPVNHAPVFPAVAYRFDYKGRSVVISGDAAPSPSLAAGAAKADVLFHEGLQVTMVAELQRAAEESGRPGTAKIMADIPSYHTTPEQAAALAAQAGVRQLVFYHTIPPLPVSYLNAVFLGDAPRTFAGPITVSTDGLLVSLPAGSTTIAQRNLL